jgi:hypothetical protein
MVLAMMAVKKPSKSPLRRGEQDQFDPNNEDRGGSGALFHGKLSPPTGMGGVVPLLGRAFWSRLQAVCPPVSVFFSNFFFSIKTSAKIFRNLFQQYMRQKDRKKIFLKTVLYSAGLFHIL